MSQWPADSAPGQVHLPLGQLDFDLGDLHSDLGERHFRRVLDKLPAAAYTCDPDGLITYFNQQAVTLWGRAPLLNDPTDRFCGSFRLFSKEGAPISHGQCWMALALQTDEGYNGGEIIVQQPGGERLTVLAHANPIHDDANHLIGAVNVLVDITDRKHAEEALKAAQERETLLRKEIHHRVKNNLQVISSLLYLQSRQVRDPQALEILRECQTRTRSIALVHETLYQSSGEAKVEMAAYVKRLVIDLFAAYEVSRAQVEVRITMAGIDLELEKAIPFGLITTELVSNALKHAFPNRRSGEIGVELKAFDDHLLRLRIYDNGIGLPPDFDLNEASTLGVQLVRDLSSQIDGTVNFSCDGGTVVTMTFPH